MFVATLPCKPCCLHIALSLISHTRLLDLLGILLTPPSIFFFNDTATTEIYTLSLHDALPILPKPEEIESLLKKKEEEQQKEEDQDLVTEQENETDRKSTRLNSSHTVISYAVFCLKKKKKS